jgi:hypothetical protein
MKATVKPEAAHQMKPSTWAELVAPLLPETASPDSIAHVHKMRMRGATAQEELAFIAGLALSERDYVRFRAIIEAVREKWGGQQVAEFMQLVADAWKRYAYDGKPPRAPTKGEKIFAAWMWINIWKALERKKTGLAGDGEYPLASIAELQDAYEEKWPGEPVPGESTFRDALNSRGVSYGGKKPGRPFGIKDSPDCDRQQRKIRRR